MNNIKVNGTQEFMGINISIIEGGFGENIEKLINCDKMPLFYRMYEILNHGKISGVYFIRNLDNGYVKIGKSKNIIKRYKEIKTAIRIYAGASCEIERIIYCSPMDVTRLEARLHNYYKNCHIDGEFYDIKTFNDEFTNHEDCCYDGEIIVNKNFIQLEEIDFKKDILNCLTLRKSMGLDYIQTVSLIKLFSFIKEHNCNFCINKRDNLYYQLWSEESKENNNVKYEEIYDYYDYLLEVFCAN